jgi:hypothetical protein
MYKRERHTILHRRILGFRLSKIFKTANIDVKNRGTYAALIKGIYAAYLAEIMPGGMSVPLIMRQ